MNTNKDSQWDILVAGGANIDYLGRGPKLPTASQPVNGEEFLISTGGKGANQAVAAARLGARAAFLGCMGSDERGDWILEELKEEGVDTRFVVRDAEAETGVVLLQVDQQGHKQTLAVPGANRRLAVSQLPQEAMTASSLLLIQLEIPIPVVEAAIHMAKEAGILVVLDPAPAAPLPEGLFPFVDLIKPNANEAEFLTGIKVRDQASARQAAKALLRRGVRAAAVQAGPEGNLVVWEGGESWNPVLPVDTIDTTGAGDAFAAAMSVCLVEGKSLEEAGPIANAAAALATTKLGAMAGLPYRQELDRLLRNFGQ